MNEEFWTKLRQLRDRSIYGFSLVAIMEKEGVHEEDVNLVFDAVDYWKDETWGYRGFDTEELCNYLEANKSEWYEGLSNLCNRIGIYAYHAEEASCGQI